MPVQKVALITASSAGLGAQIARAFAPDFRVVSPPTMKLPHLSFTLRHILQLSLIDL
jgi:hypothetical protein